MLKNIKEKIYNKSLLHALCMLIFLIGIVYLACLITRLEKQTIRIENILKTELEQVYLLLEEEHHDIANFSEQNQAMLIHHKEMTQAILQIKNSQESLKHLIDQQFIPLDEKLKALTQSPTEASSTVEQEPSNKHHFLAAQGYRIFGVQSYGVIVVTPTGEYVIARIGQKIGNLGVVKMIAAHKIVVGQSIITDGSPE